MRPTDAFRVLAFLVSFLLITLTSVWPWPAMADTSEPMTNEDVVVLFVRGVPEDEIVARIRAREPGFDLSDEMVRELRLAGLPPGVLAAMAARRSEVEPGPPASDATENSETPVEGPILRVTLEHDDDGAVLVTLPAAVPDAVARSMDLPAEPEARRIHSMALFVACLEATHVPDRWRNRSPVGRDFLFAPRHRMIAFEAGAPADPGQVPGPADPAVPVAHRVPARLDAPLPGDDHVLLVGLALRIGDRWRVYRTLDLDGGAVPPEGRDVVVRIRGARRGGLDQELERVVEPPGD